MRGYLQSVTLKEAITFSESWWGKMRGSISGSEAVSNLGVEIVDLSVLAIKPTPDTSRALEADVRERLLKEADEAIYSRRNAAVEQERAIKENELNTEIAVESKKRLIKEEEMAGRISIEKQNKDLIALAVENTKQEADARAYGAAAIMKVFADMNPEVLQALATAGMDSEQLIALAFRGMADRAQKIGQLNITPDLLSQLLKK